MDNQAKGQLYKQLGIIIRKLRMSIGLKQHELANQIGLSRVSIVNIEKGRHKPQLHILYDLSVAFGCSPSDLIPNKKDIMGELPSELSSKLKKSEKDAVADLISKAEKGE